MPGPLRAVLAKGLAKERDQRYGSARELAQTLRAAALSMDGVPTLTLPVPPGSLAVTPVPAATRPFEDGVPETPSLEITIDSEEESEVRQSAAHPEVRRPAHVPGWAVGAKPSVPPDAMSRWEAAGFRVIEPGHR